MELAGVRRELRRVESEAERVRTEAHNACEKLNLEMAGLKGKLQGEWEEERRSLLLAAESAKGAHERAMCSCEQALEMALKDSIRLCVVSPTVSIKLEGSGEVQAHGSLSSGQIRTFVEDEVLPKFTRLLLRPGQARHSADGAADVSMESAAQEDPVFDSWLRGLLLDMQRFVEQHVATVFGVTLR
eukprot:TRINITY_DN151_c0_g2_i1.p1 TRINITY_DN151_c0_g2~~TRINITY_DN151_c0_g2_i1.p1  ORF type:complete len:186 (+),score=34.88 TRINITY_DN151_c0_g2_i1:195-752(+)